MWARSAFLFAEGTVEAEVSPRRAPPPRPQSSRKHPLRDLVLVRG